MSRPSRERRWHSSGGRFRPTDAWVVSVTDDGPPDAIYLMNMVWTGDDDGAVDGQPSSATVEGTAAP